MSRKAPVLYKRADLKKWRSWRTGLCEQPACHLGPWQQPHLWPCWAGICVDNCESVTTKGYADVWGLGHQLGLWWHLRVMLPRAIRIWVSSAAMQGRVDMCVWGSSKGHVWIHGPPTARVSANVRVSCYYQIWCECLWSGPPLWVLAILESWDHSVTGP